MVATTWKKTSLALRKKYIKKRRADRTRNTVTVIQPWTAARRFPARNTQTGGFLGIEKKFYDTSLGYTGIVAPTDAAGGELDPSSTSMMSTPTQGTSEQQRDGKRIVCKYLEMKGNVTIPLQINQTALDDDTLVTIFVVLDTQSNAAQMNSEDCFKNTGAIASLAANPLRNLLFGPRFRILKQQTFRLFANVASWDGTNMEQGGCTVPFSWFIPLKNLVINFNSGTTASIANVVDNSIHVIGYGTTALASIGYNARLRFVG